MTVVAAQSRTGRRAAAAALTSVLLLVAVAASCGSGDDGARVEVVRDPAAHVNHDIVIPRGTNNRVAAGEKVSIVPRVMTVHVGDSIRVRNDDDYGTQVGIFRVAPGETVTMRFTSAGDLSGECDVHPSGRFTIRVLA